MGSLFPHNINDEMKNAVWTFFILFSLGFVFRKSLEHTLLMYLYVNFILLHSFTSHLALHQ